MTLLMRDKEMMEKGESKAIVEMGYEFSLSETEILTRLQSKLNITEEQAQEYLKRYGK